MNWHKYLKNCDVQGRILTNKSVKNDIYILTLSQYIENSQ